MRVSSGSLPGGLAALLSLYETPGSHFAHNHKAGKARNATNLEFLHCWFLSHIQRVPFTLPHTKLWSWSLYPVHTFAELCLMYLWQCHFRQVQLDQSIGAQWPAKELAFLTVATPLPSGGALRFTSPGLEFQFLNTLPENNGSWISNFFDIENQCKTFIQLLCNLPILH